MTPLTCAAEKTRASVVELFIDEAGVSREEAISAMELLGASFANDKEFYYLPVSKPFMFLIAGM
jgi:hypothetical protein